MLHNMSSNYSDIPNYTTNTFIPIKASKFTALFIFLKILFGGGGLFSLYLHSQNERKCPGGGIGRRVGLKNQWGYSRAGSIPAPGTYGIEVVSLLKQPHFFTICSSSRILLIGTSRLINCIPLLNSQL